MERVNQGKRCGTWILFAAVLLSAPAMSAAGNAPKERARPSGVIEPGDYAGSDTCRSCHEEIYKKLERTPHWKTTYGTGAARGCEACHGPGKEHVEAGGGKDKIFNFATAAPAESSQRCLSCHQYGAENANFTRSRHNTNGVSCTACHSTHHANERQFLLLQKEPDLCYNCHTESRQDFQRPFRHRVDQGLVRCTDCHDQHGAFVGKALRTTAAQDQVCVKCHADKAGPFTFEHEPVKTEGCQWCHAPHGSSNPRLLKRASVNLLCLECHTLAQDAGAPGIPTFHNQSQKYSACTLCHPTIHGSNFDAFFLK